MNRKKMMPLLLLAAGVVVLAVLLVLLQWSQSREQQAEIPLCDFSVDAIDQVSYRDDSVEETLIRQGDGDWVLQDDPTLPLDQEVTGSLIEKFATLTATRQLQPEELAEIPARSDTPLMEFSITSGENTRTLTVDLANDVADIYYVYDENDTVYTVTQTNLAGLCKDPKDLYKAQTLTDKTIDDVAAMQVGDLGFTQTDGTWTLTDDPDYDLDQDAVKKMANTVCGVKTDWTITAPQADSAYGLDTPDVTVTATFTDGSELTVRFGNLADADTTLCYLASSGAPDLVYEASADYKNAFAVTRESLQATEATAESAAEEDTIVAEHPVGGKDDYADADQEE